MYKQIIRPILFLSNPEKIHHFVAGSLKFFFKIPGLKWMAKQTFVVKNEKLKRSVFGIEFENPIGFAAGFDKQANLYNELGCFGFSFIEVGTVTPKPQPGNPKPRSFRLVKDESLINRMGFNNIGIDTFVENIKKTKANVILGGNIGKNTKTPNENALGDYKICFEALHPYVDYLVVNLSCPNVKDLRKLQDKDSTIVILKELQRINNQKEKRKPLLLKVAPDLNNEQLDEIIQIVKETGIDGLIATNTTTSRDNLKTESAKVEQIGNGGLSGKALTKKSTEVIAYLHQKSAGKIPIIGVGGIHSPKDALDKLEAGATLVQLYTGFIFEGPFLAKKINKALLKASKT